MPKLLEKLSEFAGGGCDFASVVAWRNSDTVRRVRLNRGGIDRTPSATQARPQASNPIWALTWAAVGQVRERRPSRPDNRQLPRINVERLTGSRDASTQ